MSRPKRPKPRANWDDPQIIWEMKSMEDALRLGVYANEIDKWLTQEVLPVLRQADHAMKTEIEMKTGKPFDGHVTRYYGVPVRLHNLIEDIEGDT